MIRGHLVIAMGDEPDFTAKRFESVAQIKRGWRRTDELGRAFAGSQLQIQVYVNRRPPELEAAILKEIPDLAKLGPQFEWVSPVERTRFAEYHDSEALEALGMRHLGDRLREFWPSGGPHWDALARLELPSGPGCLLVEAKSHVREIRSVGCQATEPSREKIVAALDQARAWAGASSDSDWIGPLYQSANRIALLYFFREIAKVPTWLVNVDFVDDPHSSTDLGTWKLALSDVKRDLGFDDREPPFTASVLLPAMNRSELLDQAT